MLRTMISSAIGPLYITAADGFIVRLQFTEDHDAKTASTPEANNDKNQAVMDQCIHELDLYFKGLLQTFTVSIKPQTTPFRLKVYDALLSIPYGKTISYKTLAACVGNPKASRAVGGANNKNPIAIIIPCHRVIGTDGSLTGYAGGLPAKQCLIDLEKQKL